LGNQSEFHVWTTYRRNTSAGINKRPNSIQNGTTQEQENMNTYSWNAKDYERNSQAQQKWARELMANLHLTGIEDILDLGCGDGKVTVELARLVADGSVVGVDNSRQMIDLAKETIRKTSILIFRFK
jgi:Methylase involved in ubiquinone/menaquinone biosynthesis